MNFQTKCTSCNSCSFSVTSSSLSGSASSINRWASFCLSAPCGSSGSRGTWPNNSFIKVRQMIMTTFPFRKRNIALFWAGFLFGQELFASAIWGIRCRKSTAEITLHRSWKTATHTCKLLNTPKNDSDQNSSDQFRTLGNCPPTPPLIQHFALSEK